MAEAHYRIGTVARLSGLSTHVIRVWERRYAVLSPDRTPGGARLYDDADVERLRLLKRAVDSGHSIGSLAQLSTEALARLVLASPPGASAASEASKFVDEIVLAASDFDQPRAERALASAARALSPRTLVIDVLGPALKRIGDEWASGKLCVASEHLGSMLIRLRLSALLAEHQPSSGGPPVLAATPTLESRILLRSEAERALATGKLALVVLATDPPTYWYDPTRPDSRLARLEVDAALQHAAGRSDPLEPRTLEMIERGARYIDFLVPGLLGMNLMGTGMWSIGFSLVSQRAGKLLKLFVASPMRCRSRSPSCKTSPAPRSGSARLRPEPQSSTPERPSRSRPALSWGAPRRCPCPMPACRRRWRRGTGSSWPTASSSSSSGRSRDPISGAPWSRLAPSPLARA